jgi:hypothetical protein
VIYLILSVPRVTRHLWGPMLQNVISNNIISLYVTYLSLYLYISDSCHIYYLCIENR